MCMGYSISKLVIVFVHVLKVKETHSKKRTFATNLPARPHNGWRKSRRIYSHPFVLRPRPSSAPSERSAVNIATQGSAKPPPWAESCNRFAVEESHIADRCLTSHQLLSRKRRERRHRRERRERTTPSAKRRTLSYLHQPAGRYLIY